VSERRKDDEDDDESDRTTKENLSRGIKLDAATLKELRELAQSAKISTTI